MSGRKWSAAPIRLLGSAAGSESLNTGHRAPLALFSAAPFVRLLAAKQNGLQLSSPKMNSGQELAARKRLSFRLNESNLALETRWLQLVDCS